MKSRLIVLAFLLAAVVTPLAQQPSSSASQEKHGLEEKQDAERQAQYEAQAAYLDGKAVDLSQWEKDQIAELKKEAAEKKAKEAAKGTIERLTMSDRRERMLRCAAGDDGYFFTDGNGIFRASFAGVRTRDARAHGGAAARSRS